MEAPRKDHLVGTQVGDYVIEERIGIGGMGVVYRASQKRIGKTVAIKVLRAEVMDDPREMERFLDEARAVNAVSHRGIISIFGSGELNDGRQYLVMEYLKGEGLDTKLQREGRIAAADVIPILEEITSALQGVHNAGIVHRDLKPGNVFLVEQSDGKPWVKLLDFGLARRGERTDVSRIAGTPDYLSPEHSRGLAAGPPSDLYSMGVMTFQLLTGKLPFSGHSALEVMEKHVYAEPPNALALEPSIPDALNQLLTGLMRKEPNARPTILQIKALLKEASKQVRAASTQQGEDVSPEDVLAARASAASTLSGDSEPAGAPTPDGLPLFEGLPKALAGTAPGDSGPLGTPSPGVSLAQASAARASWRQSKMLFIGLGALGAVVAVIVAVSRMDSSVQALEDRRSKGALLVKPQTVTEVTSAPELKAMPKPADPVVPVDEEPMFNPAEAELPDAGAP
jgi:eukaryotic-like serine/threonine-protein kinase